MKAQLLLLFILMSYSTLRAQDSTLVIIKAGSSLKDVLTTSDIYLYPQFVRGKVSFRNGMVATAMMNYNTLNDQMLFIDPKGDSLALKDEKTINFIALDKDTFYYADGYIRLTANNGVVKLAEKKIWKVADIRKIGSHDRPGTTLGITSYSTITTGYGRNYDLILSEDVVLVKKANYYFGDLYNHFVPAGKKNLLSFFPKKEDLLVNYLKENKVNFHKKDDLEKVALFLEQNY